MKATLNRYICTSNMLIMVLSLGTYVHVHVLSSEILIEEYQKQARVLVQDLKTKTREIEIIREYLQRTEQSR